MSQTALQVGLNGTRLVRFLSELGVSGLRSSHGNFGERLGRLIDFGDSMRLSVAHHELGRLPHEPNPHAGEGLKDEVLRARMALMHGVVESFLADGGSPRMKLPTLKAELPLDQLATFEPYHRFYAAHQRAFEAKIQSLQLGVRDRVAGVSAELARLAVLDEAMREIFSVQIRKYLAVIPRLLEKRFDFLLQEHRSRQGGETDDHRPDADQLQRWTRPDGWLDRFCKEMQGLLLAELELRFLPVLGLVEAVEEEVKRS